MKRHSFLFTSLILVQLTTLLLALPNTFNYLAPPAQPRATFWLEAEDAQSNIGVMPMDNTYGGKHRVVLNQSPNPKDYYVTFTVDVTPEQIGTYHVFLAAGPVGKGHVSPVDFYLDDTLVEKFTRVPAGQAQWGVSNAVSWTDYGTIDLSPGTHSLTFRVTKQRPMGDYYAQQFDALALVHQNDLNYPVTFNAPTQTLSLTAQANDTLTIPINLTIDNNPLKTTTATVALLELLLNDGQVTQTPVTITTPPQATDTKTTITITPQLTVPFDVPTGKFQIALTGLTNAATQQPRINIANVAITGQFPRPQPITPLLSSPTLDAPAQAQAGSTWPITLNVTPQAALTAPPQYLTVLLESAPHVAYYAQSFAIPTDANPWQPNQTTPCGPFNVQLPKDLPAATYTVHVALTGHAYQDRQPDDLALGTVTINSTANPDNTTLKPMAYGVFVDCQNVPHLWYSTPSNAMIWDGQPHLPVSGMFNGPYMSYAMTPETFAKLQENVQAVKAHGLNHLYLFTQGSCEKLRPYQWQHLMDYVEQLGFTYVIGYPGGGGSFDTRCLSRPIRAQHDIRLSTTCSLPGTAQRTVTDNQIGYSVNDVVNVLALAIDQNGKTYGPFPAQQQLTDKRQAEYSCAFDQVPTGDYEVIFLPQLFIRTHDSNPWVHAEQRVAHVAEFLRQCQLRPGFRGFVDMILANERGIYNQTESLFYEIPAFQADRAAYLQKQHSTIAQLAQAWQLTKPYPQDFATAARLFPAYWGNADENYLLVLIDPQTSNVYRGNSQTSVFWYEYLENRDRSYADHQDRIMDMVRQHVDTPITIKRCGLTERFHSARTPADRGIDGAGYEIYSTGDGLVPYGAGLGYVEMLQARKNMIGSATEFNRGWAEDMPPNWPDLPGFCYDMAVAQHMNAKTLYLFLFDVLPNNYLTQVRIIHDSRIMEWMSIWQQIINERAQDVLAHRPLVYTSWPVPDAWWASPSERKAVRLTDDAPGIQPVKATNGIWILPVFDPLTPAPLTVVTLADDPAVSYYAQRFETLLQKQDRTVVFLGLRKNLGQLSIDKYFTDNLFTIDNDICQELTPPADAKILHRAPDGKVWAMQIGNLQIVARRHQKKGALDPRYITLDTAPKNAAATASNYLQKLMGVTPLNWDNGNFRGIAYQLNGKPHITLHSTSRQGSEELLALMPIDRSITVHVPADNKTYTVTGPQEFKFRFAPGPGDDSRKGTGQGAVTFVGFTPDQLTLFTPDGRRLSTASQKPGTEIAAIPAGMTLPDIILPPSPGYKFIDPIKAEAGLREALLRYQEKDYGEAERLAREWIGASGPEFLPSFYLLLGHIRLQRGDAKDARDLYQKGLKLQNDHPALRCGLAVAYTTLKDIDRAKELFQSLAQQESPVQNIAKQNLTALPD